MIYFQFLQNENSQLLKFSFNNFQISLSVCQAVSKLIFILPCCVLNHRSGSTFSLLVQFSSILLLTTYRCLISGKRKRKMPGRLSKHAPVEGFCLDTTFLLVLSLYLDQCMLVCQFICQLVIPSRGVEISYLIQNMAQQLP